METGWKWWNNHLTKTETFGKGLPALGKRMEGPAHEEVGVGKLGKEAHLEEERSFSDKLRFNNHSTTPCQKKTPVKMKLEY